MKTPKSDIKYSSLPPFFYSDVAAEGFPSLSVIALNTGLAKSLGLDEAWLRSNDGLKVLSGAHAIGGAPALAMAYGGHQFGHWSGPLGDGRARLVGDVKDAAGLKHELHLKGSGPTPYSRRGDGKATLGSAIREYIVSESMAALGVPTSRALSVLGTGEQIMRNVPEPGAILCRSARSHIRCGTFQWAAASGDPDNLKALADFTINRLFAEAPESGPDRYRHLLRQASKRQASLIASWMGFGFIHGVMNTDNMCLSGETIDYGPCAFIDDFHPGKVFSSIDRNGRYAWNKQPEMAHWNLARLAEALLPLLGDTDETRQAHAEADLNTFIGHFETAFNTVMARKFGLSANHQGLPEFVGEAIKAMTYGSVDYTLFFRHLTLVAKGGSEQAFLGLFSDARIGNDFLKLWQVATGFKDGLAPVQLKAMAQSNPIIIARNHRVEQAIADANSGNLETFETLLKAVQDPYLDRAEFSDFETSPLTEEIVHQTFCGT